MSLNWKDARWDKINEFERIFYQHWIPQIMHGSHFDLTTKCLTLMYEEDRCICSVRRGICEQCWKLSGVGTERLLSACRIAVAWNNAITTVNEEMRNLLDKHCIYLKPVSNADLLLAYCSCCDMNEIMFVCNHLGYTNINVLFIDEGEHINKIRREVTKQQWFHGFLLGSHNKSGSAIRLLQQGEHDVMSLILFQLLLPPCLH